MNQSEAPKKITVALEHAQLDYDGEPLGELLSKALEVINRPVPRAEIWLSRWAIRAVCNAIIADGEAAFPLEVDLRKPQPDSPQQVALVMHNGPVAEAEQIEIRVPKVFLRLCEQYYKIDAAHIAGALVYTFTLNPPKSLTLVQREKPETDD